MESTKALYKDRGGVRMSFPFWGIEGKLNITWPFATLELYEHKILIRINVTKKWLHIYLMAKMFKMNREFEIPIDKVNSVKRVTYLPFLADGIRIYHHAEAPKYLIFWDLKVKRTLHILEQKGVKIENKI
jgi:hypothetical protein